MAIETLSSEFYFTFIQLGINQETVVPGPHDLRKSQSMSSWNKKLGYKLGSLGDI